MEKKSKKIRIPKQERSIEKKNRIVKAAKELFIEKGFDNTDTKEISKRAGVSIGTIYSYFEDKKSILFEMMRETVTRRIRAQIDSNSKMLTKTDDVKVLLYNLIKFVIEVKPVTINMLKQFVSLRYTDPDIEKIHNEEAEAIIKSIKSLLELFKDDVVVKDINIAARMVLIIIKESSLSYKLFKPKIKKEIFYQELAEIVYKYLFVKI